MREDSQTQRDTSSFKEYKKKKKCFLPYVVAFFFVSLFFRRKILITTKRNRDMFSLKQRVQRMRIDQIVGMPVMEKIRLFCMANSDFLPPTLMAHRRLLTDAGATWATLPHHEMHLMSPLRCPILNRQSSLSSSFFFFRTPSRC